jgi:hypothetical protein
MSKNCDDVIPKDARPSSASQKIFDEPKKRHDEMGPRRRERNY